MCSSRSWSLSYRRFEFQLEGKLEELRAAMHVTASEELIIRSWKGQDQLRYCSSITNRSNKMKEIKNSRRDGTRVLVIGFVLVEWRGWRLVTGVQTGGWYTITIITCTLAIEFFSVSIKFMERQEIDSTRHFLYSSHLQLSPSLCTYWLCVEKFFGIGSQMTPRRYMHKYKYTYKTKDAK